MKKLIVASNNEHKIKEIKDILKEFNVHILSLKEAGIYVDVEENGETFQENAHIKAKEIYKLLDDEMVIADDSGLMVDILGGEPGVYSARYCGEHGNDEKNNEKLLSKLEGIDDDNRRAQFVTAIELIIDKNTIISVQGNVKGYIIKERRGNNGFGYDPLFYIPKLKRTMAELTSEEKNCISHRAEALKKLKKEIKKYLREE